MFSGPLDWTNLAVLILYTRGMIMLTTGVDLVEIERIQLAIDKHGDRFLRRVYTQNELDHCLNKPNARQTESLAARFAAKEAAGKALGTGIWSQDVAWTDFEVVRNKQSGAPSLHLHNKAAERASEIGWREWSVSLSHDQERAIAFVVAM